MLKAKPLLSIGATMVSLSLLLIYQQDDPSAVFIITLLLGMLAELVGCVRLCPQLSIPRLFLAMLCSVGVGLGIVWLANLTSNGLNPHGFGIIVGLIMLESFLLALMFGSCAVGRWLVLRNRGQV